MGGIAITVCVLTVMRTEPAGVMCCSAGIIVRVMIVPMLGIVVGIMYASMMVNVRWIMINVSWPVRIIFMVCNYGRVMSYTVSPMGHVRSNARTAMLLMEMRTKMRMRNMRAGFTVVPTSTMW